MATSASTVKRSDIETLEDLARLADFSLLRSLDCDPDARSDGVDHAPRQVFSGHYVPVRPTPLGDPDYVAHGHGLFQELGLSDKLARSGPFMRLFSGDLAAVPEGMRKTGWACGYALSIFGTEYTRQCPFQTGNGYGDGRAISVLEAVIRGNRWEMQLKGAGRTPYCRGADGRAVLRSSVREFLAQEHMHALGVPTSRSLCLYVSRTERAERPWYAPGSTSVDPDQLVSEPVAITTRVAPSFLRIGTLELFSRRARNQSHARSAEELRKLLSHATEREYADTIDASLNSEDQLIAFARAFRERFASLVANWIRVGYCQGNFNSDNCAVGGFTLDYGPFGFCDMFDPYYQPWTGGGRHFSFFAQPIAAEHNFRTFCSTLRPLIGTDTKQSAALDEIEEGFPDVMREKMERMWAAKLGLPAFDPELFETLMALMIRTPVDYTVFFRELSNLPADIEPLKKSFYDDLPRQARGGQSMDAGVRDQLWSVWLEAWRSRLGLGTTNGIAAEPGRTQADISAAMKRVNPKYTLREWLLAPAYEQAAAGDYSLIRELQDIMTQPYAEQSKAVEERYYRLKPPEYFNAGGISQMSCSS
ncbi:protein adenylyltransferase SelO family protein [Methylonatrum kenyense]|uniref:protein adenylyltransferase SelO n=1 Tax=Methylonatrum kenyense TaxID=455253 RepID=UPI0020BFE608|nr:protein adenylyltransferase SelO family protein [Methylonatrum kenyense]MCK8515083.1 protein adenylyltransferase SelO family protein [Methylonatrum kenyense]